MSRAPKKIRRLSRLETWPLAKLKPDPRNARLHPDDNAHHIDASLKRWGQTWPLLVQQDGTIIAGHWRYKRMQALGWTDANVLIAVGWSAAEIRDYIIADNQLATLSENDLPKLREQLAEIMSSNDAQAIEAIGFTQKQIDEMLNPTVSTGVPGSLAAKFGVPPFTVLNAREGWWQNRKSLWLQLGIQSELGRGESAAPSGAARPLNREATPGTGKKYSSRKSNAAPGNRVHAAKTGELGQWRGKRKSNATPGGSAMPSASYSKNKARGDGAGRPIAKKEGDERWGVKL